MYDEDYTPEVKFVQVKGNDQKSMSDIRTIFNEVLMPLYGSQEKAIGQIEDSSDRKCFLLYSDQDPIGVLQFKTAPSNEFAECGVEESMEIKSLFVYKPELNSGKGYASKLMDKLKEELPKLHVPFRSIHCTVSENVPDSLVFFKKKGFEIKHCFDGRYVSGVKEYILSYQWDYPPTSTVWHNDDAIPIPLFGRVVSYGAVLYPQVFRVVENAHLGDIHALTRLADGCFVSGSKDNCMYKWNAEGDRVAIVQEVESFMSQDKNWITAVTALNDDYFVSAERSGKIYLWRTDGSRVKEIKLSLPKGHHVSHHLNAKRVCCLAAGLNPCSPSFFAGFPTQFDEYNLIEGRTSSITNVHNNDWMYCMHSISENRVLGVMGCQIGLWSKNTDNCWTRSDDWIVSEKRSNGKNKAAKQQRPFISCLKPVRDSSEADLFAYSSFDGSVNLLDMGSGRTVRSWREHSGKVWGVESVANNILASCSEDRSVKVWDVRLERSVLTLPDHIGEVTAMVCLSENMLVSSSCPTDPLFGATGAQLTFYDIRK